jgi:drug/metabolite transporter (DMT)-like permease
MSGDSKHQRRNQPVGAIGWMIGSSLLAALTGGAVRQVGGEYSTFELVFLRGIVATAMMLPMLLRSARTESMRPRRIKLFLTRTTFSYTGTLCLFFALANMPVADTYALLFTIPIFTILLAVIILKEGSGLRSWIVCGIGFTGALIIIRPGFVEVSVAALAALGTAVCFASANICIRTLSTTESPVRITAYNSMLMLVYAAPLAFMYWKTPAWEDIPWIIAIGVTNTLGALCHSRALSMAEARVVQPFSFLRLVWSVGVGWLMFAELPGVWTWVGAAVIFGASYYMLLAERGARRRAPGGDG